MTRLAPFIVAPLIIAIVILAGCASDTGIVLRGGQTEAQLAGDRTQCLPFVQAHTETSPDCGSHEALPALVIVFDDSNATVRTPLEGDCPSCVATSAAVSRRTVRSTSISSIARA